MNVKIKKTHENAVIPAYSKQGDAGLDLVAVSKHIDEYGNISYGTGLAFEIPTGYYLDIRPRSSNTKMDLVMLNSPATIDSGYRGEVTIKYAPVRKMELAPFPITDPNGKTLVYRSTVCLHQNDLKCYEVGDRVAQGIILAYPQIKFEEVTELSTTERGDNGYGSTGK